MQVELIVDARNAVGESPVWVPEENALYLSLIHISEPTRPY